MTTQSQTHSNTSTVITLTLPPDTGEHATLSIRCGDIDHHATFDGDTFADICRALHAGLKTVITLPDTSPAQTQAASAAAPAPEPNTMPQPAATTANTENTDDPPPTDEEAPIGKPPYRLHTPDGKHRTLGMGDPFELQERYHKTHRRYIFNDLDDIRAVARTLVQAGQHDELHILSSDGQTVQVVTDCEPDSSPDAIDTDAKQAMYDILGDETRTLAVYRSIQGIRKHGWKTHLIKQREVKAIIFSQVSDSGRLDPDTERIVEALYQVALDSAEFDDTATVSQTPPDNTAL
jgi:hypothetical protein